MTDPARSAVMRAVRSTDTHPEMIVRRLAHSLGYRHRLHRKDLPGRPDLTFPARRAVVFVHGCFWHGHECRRGSREPKVNADYWRTKISRNRERDTRVEVELKALGWRVLILWECELQNIAAVAATLKLFLGADGRGSPVVTA